MTATSKSNGAANRRKGSKWETELVSWFRESGFDAERRHLSGAADEGDVTLRLPLGRHVVVEAKAEQRINLAGYADEVEREALNYRDARGLPSGKVLGVAVVKRRNKGTDQAYVVMSLRQFSDMVAPRVGVAGGE